MPPRRRHLPRLLAPVLLSLLFILSPITSSRASSGSDREPATVLKELAIATREIRSITCVMEDIPRADPRDPARSRRGRVRREIAIKYPDRARVVVHREGSDPRYRVMRGESTWSWYLPDDLAVEHGRPGGLEGLPDPVYDPRSKSVRSPVPDPTGAALEGLTYRTREKIDGTWCHAFTGPEVTVWLGEDGVLRRVAMASGPVEIRNVRRVTINPDLPEDTFAIDLGPGTRIRETRRVDGRPVSTVRTVGLEPPDLGPGSRSITREMLDRVRGKSTERGEWTANLTWIRHDNSGPPRAGHSRSKIISGGLRVAPPDGLHFVLRITLPSGGILEEVLRTDGTGIWRCSGVHDSSECSTGYCRSVRSVSSVLPPAILRPLAEVPEPYIVFESMEGEQYRFRVYPGPEHREALHWIGPDGITRRIVELESDGTTHAAVVTLEEVQIDLEPRPDAFRHPPPTGEP